tara:strand:+ start:352 stop:702 length:351 start_codon:yes stop_codon:yes gene_type:complete
MKTINQKMDQAVMNDDFNEVEKIALNPKNAYVKCHDINLFTGKSTINYRWVDVSNVNKEYFDDLSGDCQEYVMSLDKYKDMEYEKMVEEYDKPIEAKNQKQLDELRKSFKKNKGMV